MSLPPRVPVNLGIQGALDRLGVKGGILPTLEGGIVPVLILGDIHDSIASELVEARKQAVYSASPIVARIPVMQVQCRAPGGLVLEDIQAFTNSTSGPPVVYPRTCFIIIGPDPVSLGGPKNTAVQLDIGGVPCLSIAQRVSSTIDPLAGPPPYTSFMLLENVTLPVGSGWWGTLRTRIYVQPGEWVSMFAGTFGDAFWCVVTWRELFSLQGDA